MSAVLPNTAEVLVLESFLETEDLKMKLYSNDYTPLENATVASFTEVAGGGYASKTLDKDDWTIVAADPSTAEQTPQTFTFTGPTTAPSTIYGYYITDSAGTVLRWAERFAGAVLPFTPIAGSSIEITPHMECS